MCGLITHYSLFIPQETIKINKLIYVQHKLFLHQHFLALGQELFVSPLSHLH